MPKSASLLAGAPAADHVALELFFVRLPSDKAALADALWSAVDEQVVDLGVRRHLAANGFIVGRVGGQLPTAITDLLQITSDAPIQPLDEPPVIVPTKAPLVHRKLIDVFQTETPNRLIVTGERERLAKMVVLYRDEADGGVVRGQTFKNARGSLLTKVFPQADGRIQLDIVPEIEHGDPQRQIEPAEGGNWKWQLGQPHETFDDLRLSATLVPGEILVFGSRGDRPGSLAEQFFTEREADVLQQIVVLIRVTQAKADDLFQEPERRE
jgi:hypothetical protein